MCIRYPSDEHDELSELVCLHCRGILRAGGCSMDRATLEQQLEEAEQHVLEGLEQIVTQRQIIFELARERRDTAPALQLLKRFEEIQEPLNCRP
jgi:hypothetical protein